MSRTALALRVLRLKLDGAAADPTPDYDAASASYDDYFTDVMGVHSVAMLDHVPITPGMSVIELACGTGHLTAEIVRRLEGCGSVIAVDKSPGMLHEAQQKVSGGGDVGLQWVEADMTAFVAAQQSASADLVVIGWALCYSQPVTLLREVRRILRRGGRVAVIETRSDAMATLHQAFEQVVTGDPTLLQSLIHVNLPAGPQTLRRWLSRAGLRTEAVWAGAQDRTFDSGSQAVEWLERSGAGAGFRDSFDAARSEAVRAKIIDVLDAKRRNGGVLAVQHTFVAGTARNDHR